MTYPASVSMLDAQAVNLNYHFLLKKKKKKNKLNSTNTMPSLNPASGKIEVKWLGSQHISYKESKGLEG